MLSNNYTYQLRQTLFLPIMKILTVELLIASFHYLLRLTILTLQQAYPQLVSLQLLTIEIVLLQIINLYFIIKILITWANHQYILNPKEVVIKKGFLQTSSETYEIANLQSMTVEQSFLGKIFNYGTIKLFNPVLKQEVYLEHIPNPHRYGDIIQQHEPESIPIIRNKK